MSLRDEILEQPAVLDRLLTDAPAVARAVADRWEAAHPTHVLIAARGSSDNAARYAQYLWGARAGLSVGLATPSLFGHGVAPPRLHGAAVVGISQSGASPDLVAVVEEARAQGRPTLAITNESDSPLAATADQVLLLGAGPERAVAATKTYTAQLAAVALLASAMAPEHGDDRAFASLPAAVARALATEADVLETAGRWSDIDRCAVLGRGTALATAHEWALKLQELAYVLAQPASTADFAHGPRAVVEPGFPVLGVATGGPLLDDTLRAIGELRERGARTLLLTDRPDPAREVADELLHVPPGLPGWLAPIGAIVPAQLWCRAVAIERGNDPDAPRGLAKVTLTR
jgi:glutamine---fructose-6-phosphate transaminase (isomerizing)